MLKSTRNQLNNAINGYQGKARRVLCVCSAGVLRSPTAAYVLNREYGHNTRAVGLEQDYALIPVSEALLVWADEVVTMSAQQRKEVIELIDLLPVDHQALKGRIQSLGIDDDYDYGDKTLERLILDKYENKG